MPSEISALVDFERRATGESWLFDRDSSGQAQIQVRSAGDPAWTLTLTRELQPAADGDAEFAAHSWGDVRRLVSAHDRRDDRDLLPDEVMDIGARLAPRPPGPWQAFLAGDGGMAGPSITRISDDDDQPDRYLWLDGAPAPGADFEFLAMAREMIPKLLDAITSR